MALLGWLQTILILCRSDAAGSRKNTVLRAALRRCIEKMEEDDAWHTLTGLSPRSDSGGPFAAIGSSAWTGP